MVLLNYVLRQIFYLITIFFVALLKNQMIMAGIYLHIPFCKKRCIYCDFFSTTRSEQKNSIHPCTYAANWN